MNPVEFVALYYYNTVYYFTFLVLTWITIMYYVGSNEQKMLRSDGGSISQPFSLICTLFFIYYLGLRPVSGTFIDMPMYAYNYDNIELEMSYMPISIHGEWFWRNIGIFCKRIGLNVNEYFLVIAFGYFAGMYICCIMLMRKNLWLAMLFFFTAFSTYSYGTNGIRNGMACSIELVAMCLVVEQGAKRVFGMILMFLMLGVHRSTMLPSAAALATIYMIKDTKIAFRLWLVAIPLSLTIGPVIEQIFVTLGFDDRMNSYYENQFNETTQSHFSAMGFRWDFLIYSAAPVLMIWYVTRKRKFTDLTYTMFANTYLLCNAFWIMVIRAAFSNRFAYLSWFIYPVVVAYPLLRMNLWKDQDRKTAIVLFLYSAFLFYMYFIYYFGTSGFKGFDLYWWK